MRPILLLAFTLFSFAAIAQKGTIRGKVIEDATGEAVIGASVLVKGLSVGAATDLDGDFTINLVPGTYDLEISYLTFQSLTIEGVEVASNDVNVLGEIRMSEASVDLDVVVVTAKQVRNTETALLTMKRKAPVMMDGISSAKISLAGDGTAVEAAKRVTGVSIEGGKYVYVRGLGDRYSKTTLNNAEIPGLDPDRNTLQMDIFPTNLIDNITVVKNFTADLPADFTGGLLNVETKDFPEEKIFSLSVGVDYNPQMHFNPDYLTYDGGNLDFLGFDDGARALPDRARQDNIPTPISGASDEEVNEFVRSFNPELGAKRRTSPLDFSVGVSLGNQISLKDRNPDDGSEPKLGYIFSLSYRNSYELFDEVIYGEYQRESNPEINELTYANLQTGEFGQTSVLIGALGGLAYKTKLNKYRLTAMHLQNGESRAGDFFIDNNGEAVGQSGYFASSDNLEYNQRGLTNLMLNGEHVIKESGWEVDWRAAATFSTLEDPDIRKTAFTETRVDTTFIAGAGGNPSRIWRSLDEVNLIGKFDIVKNHTFRGLDAKLRFGASHIYKNRDYEILFYDIQFFDNQDWPIPEADQVLRPENIFPNRPNSIYYQSGNANPNPNEYQSNVHNTGIYTSWEFNPLDKLKAILGVRGEYYVQRHTGRDISFANGGDGQNLDNEKVLDAFDLFPSANFIYSITEQMNLRAAYSRTIARPSFKELSFAQIIDPITNRIFNGSLFQYPTWDGNLQETRINNVDLRWEYFLQGGQIFSVSAFYKTFDKPIELVRIPAAQTSAEFQPRNVGDGQLYGIELEFRKNLDFISPGMSNFNINGNFTFVESQIEMTDLEFNARQNFAREGETVDNTREMAGQAPWVVNAGIGYSNFDLGLNAGFFYNVKGRTLTVISSGLYPDVYLVPFHSLNFGLTQRLGKDDRTTLSINVENILNDEVDSVFESFEAEDQFFQSINPGIAFGVGITHRFQ